MSKSYAAKDAARKRRGTRRKAIKVMAERNSLPTIAVWELGDAHRGIAAQFEKFGETQVPDGMRELAERSVAQTREVYEHSKNTLQSVFRWEHPLRDSQLSSPPPVICRGPRRPTCSCGARSGRLALRRQCRLLLGLGPIWRIPRRSQGSLRATAA